MDGTYLKTYYSRGLAYYYLGQYQRAIQDFDEALQLWLPTTHHSGINPLALAYNLRAYAYSDLGQYAKAEADKAKACRVDSELC